MFKLLGKTLISPAYTLDAPTASAEALRTLGENVHNKIQEKLGRSLAIRHVDAGSCNGCELEVHALNNPYYDLERFGLHFVASPRHADVLLVSGPVSTHMAYALKATWEATPNPKWVIASGDCAINGGLFTGSYAIAGGVDSVIPVDMVIRGCPPSPMALLSGLLALLEHNQKQAKF